MNLMSTIFLLKRRRILKSALIAAVCLCLITTGLASGVCCCGEGCLHCIMAESERADKAVFHAEGCCAVDPDMKTLKADHGTCNSINIPKSFYINSKPFNFNLSGLTISILSAPACSYSENNALYGSVLTPTARSSPLYLTCLSFLC